MPEIPPRESSEKCCCEHSSTCLLVVVPLLVPSGGIPGRGIAGREHKAKRFFRVVSIPVSDAQVC